jgi:vacuolar-type H+-ATPase subunit I/STV1
MAEGRYLRDILTILSPEPIEDLSLESFSHNQDESISSNDNNTILKNGDSSDSCRSHESHELSKIRQRLEDLKQQNKDIQARKRETLDSYATFLNQYEYGLNSIKKLNDLMDAPDNIMNGNQTKEAL